MQSANLALRFLLELCALVAFGLWGFRTGPGSAVATALGLGAPLLAALVWGFFVSPKAPRRLPDPARLLVEIVFFGLAAAALAAAGLPALALIFAGIAALNLALLTAWKRR